VPPYEALLEVFLIFGFSLGAEGGLFWLQKASFLRSDFWMLFGVRGSLHLGGVGGMAETPEKEFSLLISANLCKSVSHASLPLRGAAYRAPPMPPTPQVEDRDLFPRHFRIFLNIHFFGKPNSNFKPHDQNPKSRRTDPRHPQAPEQDQISRKGVILSEKGRGVIFSKYPKS